MLIESFNIRGLKSRIKKKNVREFIVSKSLEFITIQEYNIDEFSDSFVQALCGILSIIGVFHYLRVIVVVSSLFCVAQRDHISFLLVIHITQEFVLSRVSKAISFVVNIFSKYSPREKRALWRDLLFRRVNIGWDIQCIIRDFNYICASIKRIGWNVYVSMLVILIMLSSETSSQRLICLIFIFYIRVLFCTSLMAGEILLDRILISDDWWELWGLHLNGLCLEMYHFIFIFFSDTLFIYRLQSLSILIIIGFLIRVSLRWSLIVGLVLSSQFGKLLL